MVHVQSIFNLLYFLYLSLFLVKVIAKDCLSQDSSCNVNTGKSCCEGLSCEARPLLGILSFGKCKVDPNARISSQVMVGKDDLKTRLRVLEMLVDLHREQFENEIKQLKNQMEQGGKSEDLSTNLNQLTDQVKNLNNQLTEHIKQHDNYHEDEKTSQVKLESSSQETRINLEAKIQNLADQYDQAHAKLRTDIDKANSDLDKLSQHNKKMNEQLSQLP